MRYNNYHKHDHYSNIRTPDVIAKPQDYINRALELEHVNYFTTNHGCSSNVFEAYDLCQNYNLKCIYGMEMYYTDNRQEKIRDNTHIVVIGLTKNAYYEINRISSEANKTGFYYHPRVDMELLLSLPKDEVIITTACINNRIYNRDDGVEKFLLPLKDYFGDNFMLEVQDHKHKIQMEWNKKILELQDKYNIPIIHANDSHYIYPNQSKDRTEFLLGKGMNYGDEDSFILDYPDYETVIERYKRQGVLSEHQVKESLENTLIFDEAEDLKFDKEIKMPTIYKDLNPKERLDKLKKIVARKWNEEKKDINKTQYTEYRKAIKLEMDIIEKTNEVKTADYFLINEKIIDLGINKYGGVLTRTGRGSAVSFYTNKLLKFTEVDRLDSDIPLYPTRFMSASRILESRSLPDVDFNTANPEPFIKASKEVLGEDGVYYMLAYGTMQDSEAFRNLCRARNYNMEEYNEIAKDMDSYKNHTKWGSIIDESKKFIGVIDSVSPSPCSFLLLDKPISKEIGLIKINNELCCCIDGNTSDEWKFLKNDILTVTVWDIISKVYKRINKPIPNIKELRNELDDDVWDLYKNKMTATLNQVASDWATTLVSKYNPKTVAELTAFVAAIRPSFASLLNGFLNREEYTTGTPELDKLLESSFHYLLYQENIMQYFTWLGIEEDQTYGLIKKIAKKKLDGEELEKLETILHKNWIEKIGNDEKFNETWQVIQNSAKYGFNSSHALSVALDSLYGANAKAKYPLEYYTEVLNIYESNPKKTARIISELDYFNIKLKPIEFGKSKGLFELDKETNSIYQGIGSIKFLNSQIADELYILGRENKYKNFLDLLIDIKEKVKINSRQLRILTILNFFERYGKNKKLLNMIDIFDKFNSVKQININKIDDLGLNIELLEKYSGDKTPKLFRDIDNQSLIKEMCMSIENNTLPVKEQIKYEMEYLEFAKYTNDKAPDNFYMVTAYKTFKDKTKPYISLYNIKEGFTLKTKIKNGKGFSENPFSLFDILKVHSFKTQYKSKLINGKWGKSDELEEILTSWEVY